MIQQVIERILNKKDWSSVKFYTATSSRLLMSDTDEYEVDSFCLYIFHNSFGSVDIIDLQKIESLEIKKKKTSGSSDDIPFYQSKAVVR